MSAKCKKDFTCIQEYSLNILDFFRKKGLPVPDEINIEIEKISRLCNENIKAINDENERVYIGKSIMNVQESEQKRISRELHDGPAQHIANLLFHLQMYEKYKDCNPEKADLQLKKIKKLGEECLAFLRYFIRELRPMSLDDLGLIPALKRYTERFSEENGIMVELKYDVLDLCLSNEIKSNFFRVFQEALQNIKKHSNAKNVNITIKALNNMLHFSIRDNGKGFDISKKIDGHFGIIGMKERIELLGGSISIFSKPENGCIIEGKLPIG